MTNAHKRNTDQCFPVHAAVLGRAPVGPAGRPRSAARGDVVCTVVRRDQAHHTEIRMRVNMASTRARQKRNVGVLKN